MAEDNASYLRDLAERLMCVPVSYGVDGGDIDRLSRLAREMQEAPATPRHAPSEEEEIARVIHPEAFLVGSPDYYGPDIELSWSSAAQRVALKKAAKVLALLTTPDRGEDMK